MDTPERIQTEDPSYVRDMNSKALLNTDVSALERHRKRIARSRAAKDDLTQIRHRQERTEERLDDIAAKLNQLFDLLKR